MIIIPTSLVSQFGTVAGAAYPEECCGFLIGKETGGRIAVEKLFPIPNQANKDRKRAFVIPADMFRDAEAYAEGEKLKLCGVYHSHPDYPAAPSAADLTQALSGLCYAILAVRGGIPGTLTAWRLAEDRSHFDPVSIHHGEDVAE